MCLSILSCLYVDKHSTNITIDSTWHNVFQRAYVFSMWFCSHVSSSTTTSLFRVWQMI
eukprot:m.1648397 g.1648397  ORF g.1648397 m.1648397 type:complete len:58 (+) comp79551_c0_seq1:303-476(+)